MSYVHSSGGQNSIVDCVSRNDNIIRLDSYSGPDSDIIHGSKEGSYG